jgi:hypothetical protein
VGLATLTDFDRAQILFSFRKETFQAPKPPARFSDFDLMLDLPRGLLANSRVLTSQMPGSGGIVAVGRGSLEAIREAPRTGYQPALRAEEIVLGHIYCVRTHDGKSFGKIQLLEFDRRSGHLTFKWVYQTNGSRRF